VRVNSLAAGRSLLKRDGRLLRGDFGVGSRQAVAACTAQ